MVCDYLHSSGSASRIIDEVSVCYHSYSSYHYKNVVYLPVIILKRVTVVIVIWVRSPPFVVSIRIVCHDDIARTLIFREYLAFI